MAKNLKMPFLPFSKMKDPLKKIEAKNIYFHTFLGNIVVHIQAKYRKDRMKVEEAYWILKKGWRTDRRTTDTRRQSFSTYLLK